MDALTRYLLTPDTPSHSKEDLMLLAKRAAAQHIQTDTPLNDTVAGLVKEANLNREQAHRVVQMANTYTARHVREKLAGHKGNIDFDLASLDAVYPKAGFAQPAPPVEKVASFHRAPKAVPAHLRGVELHEVFGFDREPTVEKTASDDAYAYFDTRELVQALKWELEKLAHDYSVIGAKVQDEMHQALMDGERPTEVIALLKEARLSDASLAVLTAGQEHLYQEYDVSHDGWSLPITDHPLYGRAAQLAQIEAELQDAYRRADALDPSIKGHEMQAVRRLSRGTP